MTIGSFSHREQLFCGEERLLIAQSVELRAVLSFKSNDGFRSEDHG